VTSPLSLRAVLVTSHWNQRGWTYQEHMLSTQCLYLLDDRMVFQCSHGGLFSDWHQASEIARHGLQDTSLLQTLLREQSPRSITSTSADAFRAFSLYFPGLVAQYSSRQLTHDEDILDAFAGIGAAFARKTQITMAYGLPLNPSILWAALLWTTVGIAQRRKFVRRCRYIPSWTWSGWRGKSTYIDAVVPGHSDMRPEICDAVHDPRLGQLDFKTSTARLTVSYRDAIEFSYGYGDQILNGQRLCFRVYDKFRRHCGVAFGLAEPLSEIPPVGIEYECVLISRSSKPTGIMDRRSPSCRNVRAVTVVDIQGTHIEITEDLKTTISPGNELPLPVYLDDSLYGARDWAYLNVLIVQPSSQEGSLERVGVAQIYEDAWLAACPTKKTVWLV
jgi:hypothetical protein